MATSTQERPASFYRDRQLAVFIPVVAVPFLALLFWFFGGGKGQVVTAAPVQAGINLELAQAVSSTITRSKLDAYAAPVDSLRNRELVGSVVATANNKSGESLALGGQPGAGSQADQAVSDAQKQLAALQAAQKASPPATAPSLSAEQQLQLLQAQQQRDLDDARTQAQIAELSRSGSVAAGGGSALAIRPAAPAKKTPATRAVVVDEDAVVSSLGSRRGGGRKTAATGFRGFDSESGAEQDANTLPAVIHESQEVVSGSQVKMRLTEPAVVNGHQLAANTFLYGTCSLAGERLNISIASLKSGNNVFPAALEVFDVDGLSGLHIPGAITRDAGKEAGADALSATDALSMSVNPATAAAGVVVNAARGLGQKKIRLVKVRLKAGYHLMLKVENR